MCTLKELRSLYGVSYKIMKHQLKPFEEEIGPRQGNFYSNNQVIKIFELLGEPADVEIIYPSTYISPRRNPPLNSL